MQWNNTLTELNHYLANLYDGDVTNTDKVRLSREAGLKPAHIGWEPKPVSTWYNILKVAADRNRVSDLLKAITKEEEGNENDEFLLGALTNILSDQDAVQAVKLPAEEWKSTAKTADTQEKIMGKRSNLLPIGFLERGTDVSKAVVRIVVGNELGTGFMLQNGWLLTNNHVLPTADAAATAKVEFGYQFPKELKTSEKTVAALFPDFTAGLSPGTLAGKEGFFTSVEADWTLVKLAAADAAGAAPYGFVTFSEKEALLNDFANIIQHPLGGPKQISLYNNLIMYVDENVVQYMNETMVGSSGSPVFNVDWEVIALHHSGGWIKDPATNTLVFRNEGINIQKVAKVIAEKGLFN